MQQRKQIALFGWGYVGKALHRFLKDHYDVVVIDPHVDFAAMSEAHDPECPEKWGKDYSCAAGIEHAVVCVPTPTKEDGWSCDTSIVEDVLKNTDCKSYLVKSTVAPGTIDRLIAETGKRIAFSAEYIGEGKYEIPFWKDMPHPTNMKLHTFHLFGGTPDVTTEWLNIFQKVAGWTPTYVQRTAKEVETVKYAENMFLATKKIFCDELYETCQAIGVDYNNVKEMWLLDGRIGRSMTLIFPDARGFSGKCLPKDTHAIVAYAKAHGYNPTMWQAVIEANERIRAKYHGTPADGGSSGKATADTPSPQGQ